MHELGIAKDIVNRVLLEVRQQEATGVSGLNIRLGQDEHFNKEALAFGIQAASEGTLVEGAQVRITVGGDSGVILDSIELTEAG